MNARNLEILRERIAELHGVGPDSVSYLRGFENIIFDLKTSRGNFIVRISPNHSLAETEGEVEWMLHLRAGGAGVAAPVPWLSGRYLEEIGLDGKTLTAATFEKAEGKEVSFSDPDIWNVKFRTGLGRTLGQMHGLSTVYRPKQGRPGFETDRFLITDGILDPNEDARIISEYRDLQRWLLSLPREEGAYGMVHGDLNWGNYLVDGECNITVFDFDACCLNWFGYDIAIAIYSLIWELDRGGAVDRLSVLVPEFAKGYCEQYSLDRKWFSMMPDFLYFHDHYLYTAVKEAVMAGNDSEDWPSMLEILRQRCESGISRTYFRPEEWVRLFAGEPPEVD